MPKVFKRLADQVAQQRGRHRPMRPGVHTIANSLLAYMLEVDDFLHHQFAPTDGKPPPAAVENVLVAGEQLREDAKRWLGGV